MPSVTPQPEEYDVRSGLGRKDATPLRWRPLPSTPACATPMPLPHAHSRVLFTLQAPLRIPGRSQALAKTPPSTLPGRRRRGYSGSRAGRAVGIFHGPHSPSPLFPASRAPPPGTDRRWPCRALSAGACPLAPPCGRSVPGDRWNDPYLPGAGPCSPCPPLHPDDHALRPLPLQLLPEGIQGQSAMATLSGR